MIQGQPGQMVCETLISKIIKAKWTGGVAQGVDPFALQAQSPEFKPHSHQKKKKEMYKELTETYT
jgi:hypothetical protein